MFLILFGFSFFRLISQCLGRGTVHCPICLKDTLASLFTFNFSFLSVILGANSYGIFLIFCWMVDISILYYVIFSLIEDSLSSASLFSLLNVFVMKKLIKEMDC